VITPVVTAMLNRLQNRRPTSSQARASLSPDHDLTPGPRRSIEVVDELTVDPHPTGSQVLDRPAATNS